MSTSLLFAHPRVIAWRNRLRQNSLVRGVYISIAGRGDYEARFSRELLNAVRPGDVVWDVGANIGHYAAQFVTRRAEAVVCFEPAPAAVAQLQRRFADTGGGTGPVRIVAAALGSGRSTAKFLIENASSPNNQIVTEPGNLPTIDVEVYAGDAAQLELGLPAPNVLKVDVEGYELEVLQGLPRTLASPLTRSIFVEVHFSLLHGRGLDHAPATILGMLRDHGYRARWVDPSHIAAHRN